MRAAARFIAIALLACTAACSSHAYSAGAFSRMTFSPPPQSPQGPPYVKRFHNRPFERSTHTQTPVYRSVAWRHSFSEPRAYPTPQIAALPNGVVVGTAGGTTMLDRNGNIVWHRGGTGVPVAIFENRIYAASSAGAIALDPANGRVIAKYGSCPRQSLQWIVPSSSGVLTGCGSPLGSATLTAWSTSGIARSHETFAGENLLNAGWRRVNSRYAELFGSSDGARLTERYAFADLQTARISARFDDAQRAGYHDGKLLLWRLSEEPGAGSTLMLQGVTPDGGTANIVGRLRLASGDDYVTEPIAVHVYGKYTYLYIDNRLFRYAYPFRGVPELVQADVSATPVFSDGLALMRAGTQIRLANLAAGTERRLSNANAPFAPSMLSRSTLAGWETPQGVTLYDFGNGSLVRIATNCPVMSAAADGTARYLLCRRGDHTFSVEAAY